MFSSESKSWAYEALVNCCHFCYLRSLCVCMFVFLRHELEQLWLRIQTVEEDQIKPAQAELFSLSAATADQLEDTQVRSGQEGGEEKGIGSRQKEGNKDRKLGKDVEKRKNEKSQNYKREKAANIIQTNWKEHRNRVSDSTQCKNVQTLSQIPSYISISAHSILRTS